MRRSEHSHIRINADRLARAMERLAQVGTTRVAFSEADRLGREIAMELMREAGLTVTVDPAGNIIGRRDGRTAAPAIAFGSHLDTVPSGGRYDGVLGCVAGIECLRTLQEAGIRTEHPLEVIVFANEEGHAFPGLSGSRAMVGELDPAELLLVDARGRTFAQAIEAIGGDPRRIREAARRPEEILAYVELHVEQGGTLERLGVPIGIVEGITGILYSSVRILGEANHSGTTPMTWRRDALLAAARFILLVHETIRSGAFCMTGTIGQLEVIPNARNVIPGEVRLTLELRDVEEERITRAWEHLRRQAEDIALAYGVQIEIREGERFKPARADARVMRAIEAAATALGFPFHRMPSGAGHDAQMMARIAPMGMIFVPSAGGISHSEREFTALEDCVNGANVLLQTILYLDTWGDL